MFLVCAAIMHARNFMLQYSNQIVSRHRMFLEKLEIQGFKSFAEKTTLIFPGYKGDHYDITAVIGPNGSGKSNIADGIRWVLGEQSLKLLRSKRAEDVIFFGSTQKAQKGFCEVSLTFNNDDRSFPVDFAEVVITRRLYRDGASEYLLNKNKVRLADITLMLAQAHIGQRSYSVVGQGMVDAILQTAPAERKEFFNEAVGVRQYQIKRDSAASKLKGTSENLAHAVTVLTELEPRMKFFARQLKRLLEREEVEREYAAVQKQYLNALWNDIAYAKDGYCKERDALSDKVAILAQKQLEHEQTFIRNEAAIRKDDQSPYRELSGVLAGLQNERQRILTRLSVVDSRLQTELVASGNGQRAWLSQRSDDLKSQLKKIDDDLSVAQKEYDSLGAHEHDVTVQLSTIEADVTDGGADLHSVTAALEEIEKLHRDATSPDLPFEKLREILDVLGERIQKLKGALARIVFFREEDVGVSDQEASRTALLDERRSIQTRREILAARMSLREDERKKTVAEHEAVTRELEYLSLSSSSDQHAQAQAEKDALVRERDGIEDTIARTQGDIDRLYESEKEVHRVLLALQKEMSVLAKEHDVLRDDLTRVSLEIAKLEARQEELLTKLCDDLRVEDSTRRELCAGTETVYSSLGFFPEVPAFDRDAARQNAERLRRKLEQIGTIDADAMAEHEEAKQRYEFLTAQVADLTQAKESLERAIEELDTIIHELFQKNLEGISKKFGHYFQQLFGGGAARLMVLQREIKRVTPGTDQETEEDGGDMGGSQDGIAGIEIEATPPGKRFKSLSFLSGGEKALTAIALLCAILAQNPSPFVVLDEVDAALDESNANRFASIIKDLSTQTQFILITHNRVTMHIGQVLYGITMGEGGISHSLSLDIRNLDGIVTE